MCTTIETHLGALSENLCFTGRVVGGFKELKVMWGRLMDTITHAKFQRLQSHRGQIAHFH